MSLAGKYYDSHNTVWGLWGGSSEFEWFWGVLEGLIPGDQYGTGPIPMPQLPPLPTPPVEVPPVISEVPETWEDFCLLHPELCDPILETRPGETPDPYPQPSVIVGDPTDTGTTASQDDLEEDKVAHNWGHLAREFIGQVGQQYLAGEGYVAGSGAPTTAQYAGAAAAAAGTPTPSPSGDCDGMSWSGGVPPKGYKVVNSCGVGVLRKVRKRRRPRMLSRSDAQDVATIVGLVGKGQMASALINRRG